MPDAALGARLLASELGFPEGPVILADGSVVLCDGNTGKLLRWSNYRIVDYAPVGGSPWGCVLAHDGSIYVAQAGNVPGVDDPAAVPCIQRVSRAGVAVLVASHVCGRALSAPNDLTFGPDGRLWFTDSGTDLDAAADAKTPGAIYAIAGSSIGEIVVERPSAYPNGIAFDRAGRVYWTESARHAVCRLGPQGAETFCQFDSSHIPDGIAFADDGRLFVCTTISGGISVVSGSGEHTDDIVIGEQATNCAFGGTSLYVTATRTAEIHADERTGTLWRVDAGVQGAPLFRAPRAAASDR